MTTFIIFNSKDKESLDKTLNSIIKIVKEPVIMLIDKEEDIVDKIILSSTTYTMILKAGDEVVKYLSNEYMDCLVPTEYINGIRGIRLGNDVIDYIKCYGEKPYDSLSGFKDWISNMYKEYSDLIKINLY